MCVFLLLLFALFIAGLVLLCVVAVGGGGLAGAGIGAVIGSTRTGPRSPEGRELDAYRGATVGGCLGALVGLLLAAIGLTIALNQ